MWGTSWRQRLRLAPLALAVAAADRLSARAPAPPAAPARPWRPGITAIVPERDAPEMLAGTLAALAAALADARPRQAVAMLAGIAVVAAAGAALARIEWTRAAGDPVAVSLVQGNVSQAQKFDPAFRPKNFELYERLVGLSRGRIVVLPESVFP